MRIDKQKLQLAMARECLTTKELQEKSDVPKATLINATAGKNCKPATVGKIAKALNVPVENLIDMEGGM